MAFAFPRVAIRSGMVAVLLLGLLTVALSSTSFAQGTLGSVAGTVRDASGAVVPGATITLKNINTGNTRKATSSAEGAFAFQQIDNGQYTVTVERQGFRTATYTDINVLPAQQYSLSVALQVGASSETVEVTAGQDLVNTTSSEITATVEQNQILQLPLLGRNPIELIRNQAGVPGILGATRNNTNINGGRPGWTQLTQDGINIQDNFIRNNSLDFVPNRPTSDTIGEFTIITNNPGADSTGGTSQVKLVTPAGTNNYHGSLYEYNRNSALAAVPWFTKRAGLNKPQLNQNQFGGRIGGPIMKNKLFFFGSYEGYRLRNQVLQNNIIPSHDDYLTGNYKLPTGQTVNIINLINSVYPTRSGTIPTTNLSVNPEIQSLVLSKIRPSAGDANGKITNSCGDANQFNTKCYSFNQKSFTDRDQFATRIDYNFNDKHAIEFVFQRFTDNAARTDVDNIHLTPLATLSTNNKLFVGSWRWTISPTFINEFRAGDNSSIVPFLPNQPDPTFALAPGFSNNAPTLTGLNLTSPTFYFQAQGRRVTTRAYIDNATWTKGAHNMAFGMTYNSIQPHTYNFANTVPTVTTGFATATVNNAYNLTITDMNNAGYPGLTQTQVNAVNAYAAFLSGVTSQLAQTYQVKDTSTGFVAGEPNHRRYSYSIWAPYFQDSWRFKPNFTITAGLKWEYWTPLSESDGIGLLPVVTNGDTKGALLNPSGTVAPIGTFWKPDKNQFGPNFGFAWDPFSDGKTSVRGGYSLSFVNEDIVTAANNALNGNFGLVGGVTLINQTAVIGPTAPSVTLPSFNPNRTYVDQLNSAGPTAAAFAIEQNLRTPWAHQLNLEIQREVGWDTAVYVRYVGTLGRDLWRGVDYNQQKSVTNQAFFADFLRARSNLFNCGTAAGSAACGAAWQPLQWFPTFDLGGLLTNSSIVSLIRTGEVGSLADIYVQNRSLFPSAPGIFLPNSNIYAADNLTNGAQSNYHALQLEGRRRMKNGLGFQINYTFSKLLSDANGNTQQRFEPFIDNANHSLDYGRSEFHLTHIVNSNFIYELPFGKGKRWANTSNGFVERIVGGWNMSSIIRWQSGNPFSIISGRGTYNRGGRSGGMSAYTPLSNSQIQSLLGLRELNGTLYWIDPKILSTTGFPIGADNLNNTAAFAGQVFFNPTPGQVGNLKRLQFDGPASYTWDFSAAKRTRVTEKIDTEFRVDFFNFMNSGELAIFGDYNINTTTSGAFGRVTSALAPRIIQASLRVNF